VGKEKKKKPGLVCDPSKMPKEVKREDVKNA
jgi:hypothetical protein